MTTTAFAPKPASEKQVNFLNSLLTERAHSYSDDERAAATEDSREASRMISDLLKAAKVTKAPAVKVTSEDEIGEGRYALPTADGVKFYRIDKPTSGRWDGYTFVKVQASDDFYPIRGAAGRAVIEAILNYGQFASTVLYGRELGVCGHCGKTLTDEESRARGIGPICATKF